MGDMWWCLYFPWDICQDVVQWMPNPCMNNEQLRIIVRGLLSFVRSDFLDNTGHCICHFNDMVDALHDIEHQYQVSCTVAIAALPEHFWFFTIPNEPLYTTPIFTKDVKRHLFGDSTYWNTSHVTNMAQLFTCCLHRDNNYHDMLKDLNIQHWDVSNVTNMKCLFQSCNHFNEPLHRWNVSKVTDMTNMFYRCYAFNQPLYQWNVFNVTRMTCMFYRCYAFNQPLAMWNVSNVVCISFMFIHCRTFNQPLNTWNVSNVRYMNRAFENCDSFNQPLHSWNVYNVYDMHRMFNGCAMNQPTFQWHCKMLPLPFDIMHFNCFNPFNCFFFSNQDWMRDSIVQSKIDESVTIVFRQPTWHEAIAYLRAKIQRWFNANRNER